MSNVLARGLAWLNEQLARYASVSMKYHRGRNSVVVDAVVQSAESLPLTAAGPPINPNVAERIIEVKLADIVDVIGTSKPKTIDYFTEEVDGAIRVYRVAAPAIGGLWWHWSSGDRSGEARVKICVKESSVMTGGGDLDLAVMATSGTNS